MEKHDKLIKKLRDLHRDPRPASAEWLFENQVALYDAAAAIEALQAEVPKRGEWIYKPKDAIEMMFTLPKCSVCGHESSDANNYCPNCGAKMEVQDGENES